MNQKKAVVDDSKQLFAILHKIDGSYQSTIYKAVDMKTGDLVAIKILDSTDCNDEFDSIQSQIRWNTCQIKSEYIVNYKSSYINDNELWIIMDYCSVGSVQEIMKVSNTTLNEEQIQVILRETLIGLKYLHSKNIIHREIQASNIMIDHHSSISNNVVDSKLMSLINGYVRYNTLLYKIWHKFPGELIVVLTLFCREYKGIIKLGDFVVSEHIIMNACGHIPAPLWMAPEVIKEDKYSTKADIWSLGITAIEMATGKAPLSDMAALKALLSIPRNDPPKLPDDDLWSNEFRDFVRCCLVKDPDKRACANKLLNHDFILKTKPNCFLYDWIMDVMPKMEKWRENIGKCEDEWSEGEDEGEDDGIDDFESVIMVYDGDTYYDHDVDHDSFDENDYEYGTMILDFNNENDNIDDKNTNVDYD